MFILCRGHKHKRANFLSRETSHPGTHHTTSDWKLPVETLDSNSGGHVVPIAKVSKYHSHFRLWRKLGARFSWFCDAQVFAGNTFGWSCTFNGQNCVWPTEGQPQFWNTWNTPHFFISYALCQFRFQKHSVKISVHFYPLCETNLHFTVAELTSGTSAQIKRLYRVVSADLDTEAVSGINSTDALLSVWRHTQVAILATGQNNNWSVTGAFQQFRTVFNYDKLNLRSKVLVRFVPGCSSREFEVP